MANYNVLKAAIADVIKQNGNNEITGSILQQALLSMITTLGAGFEYAGIATTDGNPGTPDNNVFYITTVPGEYTAFGGITVDFGELAILCYDGSWSKNTIAIPNGVDGVVQFGANIDPYFGDDGTFRFVNDNESFVNAFFVLNMRNGKHPAVYITADNNSYTLTNEQRLVFDAVSKTFSVKSFTDSLELTEYVVLERGYNTESHKFDYVNGWAGGLLLPYVLNAKIKAIQASIDDINNQIALEIMPFTDAIESYNYGGEQYVAPNASYRGNILPCSPGDVIRVRAKLSASFSFAISFWSVRPVPSSNPQPSGFISGIEASGHTGVLWEYEAIAPENAQYVVVSTGSIDAGGSDYTGTGLITPLVSLRLQVERNTERISALEENNEEYNELFQSRESQILGCENIDISFADLPVSADGTGVDTGFLYIDSDNNIKIK